MARDVSEFLVIAPASYRGDMSALKAKIEAEFATRYPRYSFRLADAPPGMQDDEDYCVIPLMGYAGTSSRDPDEVFMCNPLPAGLIDEMCRDLKNIAASGNRSFN